MAGILRHRVLSFTYLQLLDLLTTVAFLLQGVREANPLVRLAMDRSNPLLGLVAVKTAAISLGIYCWMANKERLLGRINVLFSAVVAWNLLALIQAAVDK